ncbi:MAG: cation-translocating P-type ATPase [Firmicutes bacterium]|nr:cation-translocating P-type ATPase [Bacillota bacterium]
MIYYDKTQSEVTEELKSDAASGLSSEEARSRREKYGENKLREKKKKSLPARFFAQFRDAMILILLAAAVISFVIACYEGEPEEFFEPILILLVVIANAVIGVMQESKAERALEALKNMSAPHARVIRDGEEQIIDAADLVPGDVINLEAGDFVPADARILHSSSLKCEESALTGESVPSEKDADFVGDEKTPLGDRVNMVFSGCSVSYGTASAVVTATGMDTEMGRIANLLEGETEDETPLQKKLAGLGKILGAAALVICAVIFVIGVMNDIEPIEIFMTAVSLAVSAIPEGLPATVTVILSIGVQRMVKKNAIIRRLPAVETLGGASVICSDKTGTLTQNRMVLKKAYIDGGETTDIDGNGTGTGTGDTGEDGGISRLLMLGTLCSNGSVSFHGEEAVHVGDPTETSIVYAAHMRGMEKDALNEKYPRLCEIPFDSDRKLMTTVNRIDGKNIVIVKGAFDVMEQRCVLGDMKKAEEVTNSMSEGVLRVLAVAYKEIESVPDAPTPEELESGLTFAGLLGMIDPPRPEAREAVALCRHAGIRPVMITGDHIVTARAIAKDIGIFRDGDRAVTGAEVDAMTDSELDECVEDISVYARVSPENKIRIVKSWQRRGQIVSMTGDGVNDAPALKAADIGCAMGITGTDVAKGAADMTLTDDNFATIVDAVREGRGIYSNIKKVVGYLLGTNIGEIITVFFAMLLWHKTPLISTQLLWINLVTDGLPAVALGVEPLEDDVMDEAPRPKDEGIFANGFGIITALRGVMIGALALIAFYIGESGTGTLSGGQTLAFMVLALTQIIEAFNMRSGKSLFRIGPFTNKNLNSAALLSSALMSLVLFTPVGKAFGLVYLPVSLYLIGLVLILLPLLITEIVKFAASRRRGAR